MVDCIVGNKIGERIPGVGVTREEAEEYAEKYNAQTFEVSAKSGVGVQQLFDAAGAYLVTKYT